jgi:hypothetical protein
MRLSLFVLKNSAEFCNMMSCDACRCPKKKFMTWIIICKDVIEFILGVNYIEIKLFNSRIKSKFSRELKDVFQIKTNDCIINGLNILTNKLKINVNSRQSLLINAKLHWILLFKLWNLHKNFAYSVVWLITFVERKFRYIKFKIPARFHQTMKELFVKIKNIYFYSLRCSFSG